MTNEKAKICSCCGKEVAPSEGEHVGDMANLYLFNCPNCKSTLAEKRECQDDQ